MRILSIGLIVLSAALSISSASSQSTARPALANEEDFRRAMDDGTRTTNLARPI
jgi:hypothetical protein